MYHIISQYAKGVFNAAFASLILGGYLKLFLEEKSRKRWTFLYWIPFWTWHMSWIWMTMNHIRLPNLVNMLINLLCICVLALQNYQDSVIRKIGFSIAYLGIDVLSETLVWFVLSYWFTYKEMQELWWGSIVSRGATICAILLLYRVFKDKANYDDDQRYQGYLLFVSLGSIFVVYTIFEAYEQQGTGISLFYAVLSGIVMVGVNALVFLIHYNTCRILELRKKNEFFLYQLNLYARHQKEQEENFLEIRRMRHDLRNTLLYIQELNRHDRAEEIAQFLKDRLEIVNQESKAIIQTGHLAVDALINDKYRSAGKEGIRFQTDIQIPAEMPFEGADLAILLGNLLDNGQEAAARCEEAGRYISVGMYFDGQNLIIRLENSYDGVVISRGRNRFATRKRDAYNHGLGMGSIYQVVEKYEGSIDISEGSEGKDVFRMTIILYGKNM